MRLTFGASHLQLTFGHMLAQLTGMAAVRASTLAEFVCVPVLSASDPLHTTWWGMSWEPLGGVGLLVLWDWVQVVAMV
jgi:hypothetical protein